MAAGRVSRRTLIAGAAGAVALRGTPTLGAAATEDFSGPASSNRSAQRIAVPTHRLPGWGLRSIGTSVEGRPIERLDSRPERVRHHVVVIGGIHGDERAMADLADGFGRVDRPDDLHLTLVPLLNPDGWEAETRNNARNVDLNRNFPWGWPRRPRSGSGPASEPETQAAMQFLDRTRPDLTIWIHQPLGYVAALRGCPPWYADIWSDVAGVPVRRNLAQVGGGETWTSRALGTPSMLVEVGGSHSQPIGLSAHVAALEALLFAVRTIEDVRP